MAASMRVAAPRRGRRALRIVERNLQILRRRGWIIIVTGFAEPLLYLLAIGFGVGSLVGDVPAQGGGTNRYAVFIAPALMASSAMNGGVNEMVFNFFWKLRYAHTYEAALATPLSVLDVALGEVAWALLRGTSYAGGFIVVMAGLGLVTSPWAVLAAPGALLLTFAFAGAGAAATTWVRGWQDFAGIQLIVLPLFLFSATFYPLGAYSPPFRAVVELTPLYHGVHLLRGLTTGDITPALLIDAAYLVAMGSIGIAVAAHRLDGILRR